VLVHHGDPELGGDHGIGDVDLTTLQGDGARVGLDEPDQDLHQGRLAGTVLAQDAVDAPTVELDLHVVARRDRAVALGDAGEPHRWGGEHAPHPITVTRRTGRRRRGQNL
jgi:hypothetical protein